MNVPVSQRLRFLPIALLAMIHSGMLIAEPIPIPVYSSGYEDIGGYRVYRMETSTDNGCRIYYTPIPPTLDNFPRVAGVTLYQATQSIIFEPGFVSEDGASFVAEIVPNGFAVPQATNLTGTADVNMNWTQSTAFDETGAVISDSKQFYDNSGRPLQSQAKAFYRAAPNTVFTHVLARQTIRDAYGRDAATTLPAPIDYADFSYRSNFLQHNSSGGGYNHQNFDLYTNGSTNTDKTNGPDPIWDGSSGSPVQGTLAWYYSTSNIWEPYTPVTSYPYSRQTYYQDGTGNMKKIARQGDALKMGTGREASSYITPVANELDFYLQVRNKFFATTDVGALPGSLINQAMQTVSRDANGTEVLSIQDRSGKVLALGRAGAGLTVNNTVSVGGPSASDMNIYLFKLLASGTVNITGGTYTLYDMGTELQVSGFSSGSSLPSGYYKLVNTGAAALTLTYSNAYADLSYNFYDQKGQLLAAIAPEGVKRLYTNGLSAYATKATVPFIVLYGYDTRGHLVSLTDADRGASQFIYRNDGKIRFSQNAVQAATGSFSYTSYDQLGRPVESGQYTPGSGGVTFGSAAMTGIQETIGLWGGLSNGTMTDVSITQYDVPDNSHGLTGYVQDASNLSGAVSLTQKYSSIVNNSPNSANLVSAAWYNYDEEGKAVWMIKYINGLGYKTTDYTYDVLGHLTKKVFQAGTASETFVHYFDYDPANKLLWHVYTNTADNTATKMLQATYTYYLHGGVKRIELAGNLQGIDYTYTLQGTLKAINNSNKAQDPGSDGAANGFGADAFGEVLDYYTGDYINGRGGASVINGVDAGSITTDKFNGLIKAMTWYSEKPVPTGLSDAPTTYIYQYDPKYQFIESTWGTGINFGTAPATFSATGFNKEKIRNPTDNTPAYDGNGNIQFLQRTDAGGNPADQFAYQYSNSNNQLTSVVNTATSQTYASYTYDANGQMTGENTGDANQKYMVYDVMGNITAVYRDAGHTQPVAGFVYDEHGRRVKKLSYNSAGQLDQVTYYQDNIVYIQTVTNGGTTYGPAIAQEYPIVGGMGRLGIYYPQGPIYAYELTDHLGNTRAVIAQNGATYQVRIYTDYYPFGKVISTGVTNDDRYGYQGQYAETDPETGWNAFELRMYDSRIARWLTVDPEGENWSPYMAMGNDPVNNVDPNGGCARCDAEGFAYNKGNDATAYAGPNGEWLVNYLDGNTTVTKVFYQTIEDIHVEFWEPPGVLETAIPKAIQIGGMLLPTSKYRLAKFAGENLEKTDGMMLPDLAELALAKANGRTGNIPDPTGVSIMIIKDMESQSDKSNLNQALIDAQKTHRIDGLGRMIDHDIRNEGLKISGTFVSDAELANINSSGKVDPAALRFGSFGITNQYPVIGDVKYNNFVLFNNSGYITILVK